MEWTGLERGSATEHLDVIIVGAGQAGLALSHELTVSGVEHAILERARVGETWRHRHDSFCLVTPNWTVQLPGHPYTGPDPDGFMAHDEIAATLEDYARSFQAPVREGVMVTRVERLPDGGFHVQTRKGDLSSRALVLATGAFQRPQRPSAADTLPTHLLRIDADAYRNEGALPAGRILVVGSGQSGAQISEELCVEGREVVLACGRTSWLPRRLGGRDIVWWLDKVGFFAETMESLPTPAERHAPNPLATGHSGGRDLHLRGLHAMGITLAGRFLGVESGLALFAPDLPKSVAWGDRRYHQLMTLIDQFANEEGIRLQPWHDPDPFVDHGPERLGISDFGAVIFAGGFRPGYHTWFQWAQAYDDHGFPLQREGVSTIVPGLFFLGVHFQRTRKSALLFGVGEDASILSHHISAFLARE